MGSTFPGTTYTLPGMTTSDGETFVTGSESGAVLVYEVSSINTPTAKAELPDDPVQISLSPTNKYALAVVKEGITFSEISSASVDGRAETKVFKSEMQVDGIVWSTDGKQVATHDTNQLVVFTLVGSQWEQAVAVQLNEVQLAKDLQLSGVNRLQFRTKENTRELLVQTNQNALVSISVGENAQESVVLLAEDIKDFIVLSGGNLAWLDSDAIHFWPKVDGTKWSLPRKTTTKLCLTKDEKLMIASSLDGDFDCINSATGELMWRGFGNRGEILTAAASMDGQRLLTLDQYGNVVLHDTNRRVPQTTITSKDSTYLDADFIGESHMFCLVTRSGASQLGEFENTQLRLVTLRNGQDLIPKGRTRLDRRKQLIRHLTLDGSILELNLEKGDQ